MGRFAAVATIKPAVPSVVTFRLSKGVYTPVDNYIHVISPLSSGGGTAIATMMSAQMTTNASACQT